MIRDAWAQIYGRLTDPLRRLPSVVRIAEILASEVQEADDAAVDLVARRLLTTAQGAQLDQWGRVLGERRLGRSDEEYLAALITRVSRNVSRGTPNELIRILMAMIGDGGVEYREYPPAYGTITLIDAQVTDITRLRRMVTEQTVAGGRIDLIVSEAPVFGFSSLSHPDTPNHVAGFGDLDDPGIGAPFAYLMRPEDGR